VYYAALYYRVKKNRMRKSMRQKTKYVQSLERDESEYVKPWTKRMGKKAEAGLEAFWVKVD
jgi:predicted thioredoxin/glutaredoxin